MADTSKRYPPELRERAVRMVSEVRHEHSSEWAAIVSVAHKLGIGTAQTLANWVQKARGNAADSTGITARDADEMRRLKADNN